MFGLFTNKDRIKKLDKEINEVLDVLLNIKPLPNNDNRTNLDKEIDRVIEEMVYEQADSDQYSKMANNLVTLFKAKPNDKSQLDEYSKMVENLERLHKAKDNLKAGSQIPWEAIVVGVFGSLQLIAVLNHEELNVITSKAFGWIMRGRV
jgi:hypothetical protein